MVRTIRTGVNRQVINIMFITYSIIFLYEFVIFE